MTQFDYILGIFAYVLIASLLLYAYYVHAKKFDTIEYMDEFDDRNHMTARGCFLIAKRMKNNS